MVPTHYQSQNQNNHFTRWNLEIGMVCGGGGGGGEGRSLIVTLSPKLCSGVQNCWNDKVSYIFFGRAGGSLIVDCDPETAKMAKSPIFLEGGGRGVFWFRSCIQNWWNLKVPDFGGKAVCVLTLFRTFMSSKVVLAKHQMVPLHYVQAGTMNKNAFQHCVTPANHLCLIRYVLWCLKQPVRSLKKGASWCLFLHTISIC